MQAAQTLPENHRGDQQITLAIAASFTAEPIEEALSFWMQELAIPATIEFAPYNQIFQQLLTPSSLLSRNRQGINVVFLRIEDWCRFQQLDGEASDLVATIQRNAQDFVTALKSAANGSTTPYLLCICPASATLPAESRQVQLFHETEEWVIRSLENTNGLHLITFSEVQALYPVVGYYDEQRDRLGHIPFTSEFFVALGTAIARKIYALKHPPHKVIVLDCDNTLWHGVVGEDGLQGVDVSPAWQAIQRFMVAQQQVGMLLCLCSKNNEADVIQVFEQRQEMCLKLEHLVSWRINWLPKSENIKSLAAELNLGLDSFIFIDDNPVECAEVGANCPEVLTLQLPQADRAEQFLNHVWAFDRLKVTGEDAKRTMLYRQNLERQRFQQRSLSLEEFLSGLEMEIAIAEPTANQISRVAQLTQRTNQFNFTTIRRTEVEIQQLMQSEFECRTVTVRDRFGDYGLVGVMLFSCDDTALQLDTFLLSCRVLGRGVEHQMVRYLAQYAEKYHLTHLNLSYIPTTKNRPALSFLEAIAHKYQQPNNEGYCFHLPTNQAAVITYSQRSVETTPVDPSSFKKTSKKDVQIISQVNKSQRLGRIAVELYSPQEILIALQSQRPARSLPVDKPTVLPRTPIECDLSILWSEVLGIHPIGLNDNYFDLGGTSLQAVELFAKIEQYFGKRFSLNCLLEAPTLKEMAELINSDEKPSSKEMQAGSIVPLTRAAGTAPPLFLIHPGGGDVLLYRNLAQRLLPNTSVFAIKPLSQNGYPIAHTQISEMAASYIEQIRTLYPNGPYLLGGFCAGGIIAFEMAIQLQKQGFSVPLVTLMNTVEPQEKVRQEKAHKDHIKLGKLKRALKARILYSVYRGCLATFKNAPQFIQKRSVFSICAIASDTYKPQGQFQGELLLFKSSETTSTELGNANYSPDPFLGWNNWATGGVKVYESEGDFQGILQEPFVKKMAEHLERYLSRPACDLRIQAPQPTGKTSGQNYAEP